MKGSPLTYVRCPGNISLKEEAKLDTERVFKGNRVDRRVFADRELAADDDFLKDKLFGLLGVLTLF